MSDLLAQLLAGGDGGTGEDAYLVGTITAWDSETGQNTVAVGGVTYRNLALLHPINDPGVGFYAVNSRVLLADTPGAPVILGRLRYPTT